MGSTWSAPLTITHSHGAGGPLSLKVKTMTINGPNFPSSIGGRLTEFLVGGNVLSSLVGAHNGSTGNVATQTIPKRITLLGVPWAAQYTVVGGFFADLSRAVAGVTGTL